MDQAFDFRQPWPSTIYPVGKLKTMLSGQGSPSGWDATKKFKVLWCPILLPDFRMVKNHFSWIGHLDICWTSVSEAHLAMFFHLAVLLKAMLVITSAIPPSPMMAKDW